LLPISLLFLLPPPSLPLFLPIQFLDEPGQEAFPPFHMVKVGKETVAEREVESCRVRDVDDGIM
jgi:hypothetical protein